MMQRTAKENAAGLVFYAAVFNFPPSKKKLLLGKCLGFPHNGFSPANKGGVTVLVSYLPYHNYRISSTRGLLRPRPH